MRDADRGLNVVVIKCDPKKSSHLFQYKYDTVSI